MVCDNDTGGIKPIDLMGKQEGSFVVCIIGHHEPFIYFYVAFLIVVQMVIHYELKNLSSLATWSSTHIEHRMMRFDVT